MQRTASSSSMPSSLARQSSFARQRATSAFPSVASSSQPVIPPELLKSLLQRPLAEPLFEIEIDNAPELMASYEVLRRLLVAARVETPQRAILSQVAGDIVDERGGGSNGTPASQSQEGREGKTAATTSRSPVRTSTNSGGARGVPPPLPMPAISTLPLSPPPQPREDCDRSPRAQPEGWASLSTAVEANNRAATTNTAASAPPAASLLFTPRAGPIGNAQHQMTAPAFSSTSPLAVGSARRGTTSTGVRGGGGGVAARNGMASSLTTPIHYPATSGAGGVPPCPTIVGNASFGNAPQTLQRTPSWAQQYGSPTQQRPPPRLPSMRLPSAAVSATADQPAAAAVASANVASGSTSVRTPTAPAPEGGGSYPRHHRGASTASANPSTAAETASPNHSASRGPAPHPPPPAQLQPLSHPQKQQQQQPLPTAAGIAAAMESSANSASNTTLVASPGIAPSAHLMNPHAPLIAFGDMSLGASGHENPNDANTCTATAAEKGNTLHNHLVGSLGAGGNGNNNPKANSNALIRPSPRQSHSRGGGDAEAGYHSTSALFGASASASGMGGTHDASAAADGSHSQGLSGRSPATTIIIAQQSTTSTAAGGYSTASHSTVRGGGGGGGDTSPPCLAMPTLLGSSGTSGHPTPAAHHRSVTSAAAGVGGAGVDDDNNNNNNSSTSGIGGALALGLSTTAGAAAFANAAYTYNFGASVNVGAHLPPSTLLMCRSVACPPQQQQATATVEEDTANRNAQFGGPLAAPSSSSFTATAPASPTGAMPGGPTAATAAPLLRDPDYYVSSLVRVTWNKTWPDDICEGLCLGSLRTVQSLETLHALGITHILTCGRNLDTPIEFLKVYATPPGGIPKLCGIGEGKEGKEKAKGGDGATSSKATSPRQQPTTEGGPPSVAPLSPSSSAALSTVAKVQARRHRGNTVAHHKPSVAARLANANANASLSASQAGGGGLVSPLLSPSGVSNNSLSMGSVPPSLLMSMAGDAAAMAAATEATNGNGGAPAAPIDPTAAAAAAVVAVERDRTGNPKINQLVLEVDDNESEALSPYFIQAINFINEARAAGGKTLVHCFAGVSRSATVVVAYVMQTQQLGARDALAYVQKKRPCANPNYNFRNQLVRFEAHLKKERRGGVEAKAASNAKK